MKQPLYRRISGLIDAMKRCEEKGNQEWKVKHGESLDEIEKTLPSGSGFDSGTTIDRVASTPEKIVLRTSYHHMHESGMYDGWTEHTITVRPSLLFGFTLSISGRNRNEIKDYIHEVFHQELGEEVGE